MTRSSFGYCQITAINVNEGVLEDKVDVGWSFTLPADLAALNACVSLDHFDVEIEIIREGLGDNRKTKSEKATALARNAVFRFADVVGSKKILRVNAKVTARYNLVGVSVTHHGKSF